VPDEDRILAVDRLGILIENFHSWWDQLSVSHLRSSCVDGMKCVMLMCGKVNRFSSYASRCLKVIWGCIVGFSVQLHLSPSPCISNIVLWWGLAVIGFIWQYTFDGFDWQRTDTKSVVLGSYSD
jgi:hypothetical protein